MTLTELIANVRAEKPNSFSNTTLTRYVNELEAVLCSWLEMDREEWPEHVYPGQGDEDPELLVSAPHDSMYASWVKAKIDYANEEYQSYQNNATEFNEDFSAWKGYKLSHGEVESTLPTKISNWW